MLAKRHEPNSNERAQSTQAKCRPTEELPTTSTFSSYACFQVLAADCLSSSWSHWEIMGHVQAGQTSYQIVLTAASCVYSYRCVVLVHYSSSIAEETLDDVHSQPFFYQLQQCTVDGTAVEEFRASCCCSCHSSFDIVQQQYRNTTVPQQLRYTKYTDVADFRYRRAPGLQEKKCVYFGRYHPHTGHCCIILAVLLSKVSFQFTVFV